MAAVRIERVEAFVFRAPAVPPVQTSFGIMHTRPAVLVRLTDCDGVAGWGEVWCNFPSVGAEHRARLLLAYCKPLLIERDWESPVECLSHLSERLAVLALQTGEHGPFHQVTAAVDTAMWDLFARRAGVPLWRMLGGAAARPVPVYASGINPTHPEKIALKKRDEGFTAFKLKVGFGLERDLRNLASLRDALGADTTLMVDANQAWTFPQACEAGLRMEEFGLTWLEEPLRADEAPSRWAELADQQPLALAGGENLAGIAQLASFIASPGMSIIQPDLGKWGGITGCLAVAKQAIAAGKSFCPHWLGGGIGLVASLHLKLAAGGDGYVEVDSNPNPLREVLAHPLPHVLDGHMSIGEEPGLGVAPDWERCGRFRVDLPEVTV